MKAESIRLADKKRCTKPCARRSCCDRGGCPSCTSKPECCTYHPQLRPRGPRYVYVSPVIADLSTSSFHQVFEFLFAASFHQVPISLVKIMSDRTRLARSRVLTSVLAWVLTSCCSCHSTIQTHAAHYTLLLQYVLLSFTSI